MTDQAAPATTRRREATRARLLDAAALVFAETGLDAASVEAVCERAGYTRGAFYSNFESKEELFLELSLRTARAQVAAVRAKVAELAVDEGPEDLPGLVQKVLEAADDDRLGVMLVGEIRLHALRSRALADAYLRHEDELAESVAGIVADIARARGLRMRVTPESAARTLLVTWISTCERAVMAGLGRAEMRRRLSEALAETAGLLVAD
jgi:AcrR family transcriptional regulator